MPTSSRLTDNYSNHVLTRPSAGLMASDVNPEITDHYHLPLTDTIAHVHQNIAPLLVPSNYYTYNNGHVAKSQKGVDQAEQNASTREMNAKQARHTTLCRHFTQRGFCAWRDACAFIHDRTIQPHIVNGRPLSHCWAFIQGRCTFPECHYFHPKNIEPYIKYTPCLAGDLCGDAEQCPFKHEHLNNDFKESNETTSKYMMNSNLDYVVTPSLHSQNSTNTHPIQPSLQCSDSRSMDTVDMTLNGLHPSNIQVATARARSTVGAMPTDEEIEQVIMNATCYLAPTRPASSTSPMPSLASSTISSLSSTPPLQTPPITSTQLHSIATTVIMAPQDILYETTPLMQRRLQGYTPARRITVLLKPKNGHGLHVNSSAVMNSRA